MMSSSSDEKTKVVKNKPVWVDHVRLRHDLDWLDLIKSDQVTETQASFSVWRNETT